MTITAANGTTGRPGTKGVPHTPRGGPVKVPKSMLTYGPDVLVDVADCYSRPVAEREVTPWAALIVSLGLQEDMGVCLHPITLGEGGDGRPRRVWGIYVGRHDDKPISSQAVKRRLTIAARTLNGTAPSVPVARFSSAR